MRKSTRTISWTNGHHQYEPRALDPLEIGPSVKTTARSYSRRMRTEATRQTATAKTTRGIR